MKKIILLIIVLFSPFTVAFAQAPSILWQRVAEGINQETGHVAIATTDGGFISAGRSMSTNGGFAGNHGDFDVVVIKYDSEGNELWQKMLGGSERDLVVDGVATADAGCVLVGRTESNNGDMTGNHGGYDGFILKLDSTGTVQWTRIIGGSQSDFTDSIEQTPEGGYLVGLSTSSTDGDAFPTAGPSPRALTMRLNSSGATTWQGFQDLNNYFAESIAVSQSTDGGCITVFPKSQTMPYINGSTSTYYLDIYAVKYDAAGNLVWSRFYGGIFQDTPVDVQATADGGFIILGDSSSNDRDVSGHHGPAGMSDGSSPDLWVVKLDAAGDIAWQKSLGGTSIENPDGIKQTADGGYILTGTTYSYNGDVTGNHGSWFNAAPDVWVVKLSAAGAIQWTRCYGGTSYEYGGGMAVAPDNGYIISGMSSSIDGDLDATYGNGDMWTLRLAPDPLDTGEFIAYSSISVSPNPADDYVHIASDSTVFGADIFSMSGQKIISVSGHVSDIALQQLPAGVYLLKIATTAGALTKRIIKK
ncbi:MAG TPA: T9SS type A sorting domain-containing protein [Flavobacterium sp.]|jgi:hypothetical protein